MRQLSGEPPVGMADRLRRLAESPFADGAPDVYGDGIVAMLEQHVADLLGKPAGLWFPTGTMAQQTILRVHAGRAGVDTVAVHPLHHTRRHEEDAIQLLAGLAPVHLTEERRHPTAADLLAWPDPLAAIVVELPLQELGYVLPTWAEYTALADAARDAGIPLHLDGARLWEAAVGFGRAVSEVAEPAASVYVSLYKGLGGISGAIVAADPELLAEARVWRTRYGGGVFRQFPAAVAALDGLDTRLERLGVWHTHAAVVAEGLRRLEVLRVAPDPPHISEFFVESDLAADALNAAVDEEFEESGDRWLHGWWTDADGRTLAEATIRDPALEWSADDVEHVGRRVLDRARLSRRN